MFLCVPQVPKDLLLKIKDTILQRTVDGMLQEGVPYTGKLAGLNHCSNVLLWLEPVLSFYSCNHIKTFSIRRL